MERTAVFVDAGYLFAQGSACLYGSRQPRDRLTLNPEAVINELIKFADTKEPRNRLLRIYWYDGAERAARPTSDQAALAYLDNVKLRLGFINSSGQQKGVDSLIVTDLIELARLKSISDAVLLSGDEDVRVGVQIAQNYGVRVHLLGIVPSRGSQSHYLLQEADTTGEWSGDVVRGFLSLKETGTQLRDAIAKVQSSPPSMPVNGHEFGKIEVSVETFVADLDASEIETVSLYWKTERGVPADLDRKLLPICGNVIGRSLERAEIQHMRACFQKHVQARLGGTPAA